MFEGAQEDMSRPDPCQSSAEALLSGEAESSRDPSEFVGHRFQDLSAGPAPRRDAVEEPHSCAQLCERWALRFSEALRCSPADEARSFNPCGRCVELFDGSGFGRIPNSPVLLHFPRLRRPTASQAPHLDRPLFPILTCTLTLIELPPLVFADDLGAFSKGEPHVPHPPCAPVSLSADEQHPQIPSSPLFPGVASPWAPPAAQARPRADASATAKSTAGHAPPELHARDERPRLRRHGCRSQQRPPRAAFPGAMLPSPAGGAGTVAGTSPGPPGEAACAPRAGSLDCPPGSPLWRPQGRAAQAGIPRRPRPGPQRKRGREPEQCRRESLEGHAQGRSETRPRAEQCRRESLEGHAQGRRAADEAQSRAVQAGIPRRPRRQAAAHRSGEPSSAGGNPSKATPGPQRTCPAEQCRRESLEGHAQGRSADEAQSRAVAARESLQGHAQGRSAADESPEPEQCRRESLQGHAQEPQRRRGPEPSSAGGVSSKATPRAERRRGPEPSSAGGNPSRPRPGPQRRRGPEPSSAAGGNPSEATPRAAAQTRPRAGAVQAGIPRRPRPGPSDTEAQSRAVQAGIPRRPRPGPQRRRGPEPSSAGGSSLEGHAQGRSATDEAQSRAVQAGIPRRPRPGPQRRRGPEPSSAGGIPRRPRPGPAAP